MTYLKPVSETILTVSLIDSLIVPHTHAHATTKLKHNKVNSHLKSSYFCNEITLINLFINNKIKYLESPFKVEFTLRVTRATIL